MKDNKKTQQRKWASKGMTKKFAVYVLPAEDYVGYTKRYTNRLSQHKSNGKDISHAHIVFECDTEEQAKRMEGFAHSSNMFKGKSAGASGYRNISYDTHNGNYRVVININGKNTKIGSRWKLEDAIELRNKYYNENQ